MSRAPSFCGVILSAGESSRMGRHKALLPWRAGTFLSEAIRTLNLHTDLVIVVAGRNAEILRPVVDAHGGCLHLNPDPDRGQFSSIQVGLQAVLDYGRDSAIMTLVDRPPARQETVGLLRETFCERAELGCWEVIPRFNERGGHPVVVGREMITRFLDAPPTAVARDLQRQVVEHITYVPVDDPYVTFNIDTPEDYARLMATTAGSSVEIPAGR